MKKFLLLLLSLVSLAGFAQDLRVDVAQIETADELGALVNGDMIVLSSVDARTPGHFFNPGTLHKNPEASAENLMVIADASWDEASQTLSCHLIQKSSGKYLTQTLGTLTERVDEAFTFNILFRAPSNVEDAMPGEDTDLTVSVTDGGSNFLNSQGSGDEVACKWAGGTANWSVWYLWKATGIYSLLRDGASYYIKTQASAYSGNNEDYYYSSQDDYDIALKVAPNSDNEIWIATIPAEGGKGFVQLQNLGTDLYLHTNPTNNAETNPEGRYQSRPEPGTIVLVNPGENSGDLRNNDPSLFMLWSNRSGALLSSNFSSGDGDRYLVYPLSTEKYYEGAKMGQGMYYSNEVNDGKYGLVYRLYDMETGYPVALPAEEVEVKTAFDIYVEYMQSLTIPEISSFREGTDPGCVKNYDYVVSVITRLTELMELLDDTEVDIEDSDLWRGYLAEAKALVEKLDSFEFYPVVPGFYRFVSAYKGFMQNQGVEKAMCVVTATFSIGEQLPLAYWRDLDLGEPVIDDETGEETGEISGLNQVWEVTEGENGHLYVKNLGRQVYFTNLETQSGYAYMEKDPQWVEFRQTGGGDFNLYVAGKGYAAHCGGHSNGAGERSWIVGWNGGSGSCSAWDVRPVSREEIIETWGENVFEQAKLDAEMDALISEVETTITGANVVEVNIDMDTKLILSEDQMYSPATETPEREPGTSLACLIDGDNNTYWHSSWAQALEFGSEEQMEHYIQFDLGKAYQKLGMTYVCRPVANDKPSSFSVTASNDPDGDFEEVTTIENVGDVNNTLYKFAIDLGAEYRYIRLRATDTHSGKRGYWHASEIQFYSSASISANLFEKTGEVGAALEDALAAARVANPVTRADIDALRAAYDAFLAVYTNPAEIRAAITRAKNLVKLGGVGTGVGQKNSQTTFSALEAALNQAQQFLDEQLATCTKAALEAQCKALKDAIDAWLAVEPVKLSTGVWYYLQCPDQPFQNVNYNPVENNRYFPSGTSLRGSRVAIGNGDVEDAELGESQMHMVPVDNLEADVIEIGGNEYSYEYNDECAQWRFIAASDSTYYIQNRATGLFMPTFTAESGAQTTSYVPGAFKPAYYPGGVVNLVGSYVNNKGEKKETCLHMQTSNALLVAWPSRADNSITNGSSWEIVKAEDVASSYVQNINLALDSMIVRGLTLPYAIDASSVEGDIRFFTEVTGIDEVNGAVCCNESHDVIPAGKPMFVFCSESETGVQYGKIKMVDTNFSWDVDNSGAITGTLENGTKAPARSGIPTMCHDDSSIMGVWGAFATCGDVMPMPIGSAWLRGVESLKGHDANSCECDETFVLITTKGSLADAIVTVKDNTVKTTAIYNLYGQRVNANAKGLLIIGGKKVFIK